jgi:hypothetical protein
MARHQTQTDDNGEPEAAVFNRAEERGIEHALGFSLSGIAHATSLETEEGADEWTVIPGHTFQERPT